MPFLIVFLAFLVTTTSAQTGCGPDSYTDPVGVISSPSNNGNYDNLLDCNYNVYAAADSSLTFIFSSFHVETGDVVTISCPTNSGFTPLEFSGHSLPGPVSIPGCSHGLVNFRTDDTLVSSGFNISYSVSVGGCGNTLFTGVNGVVDSPNWPAPYGSNHNCSNIIWTQQQSTFHLHFRNFQLESCCDCDYLQIQCLDNSESPPEIHCGNKDNYMTYVYRCSQVLLLFHSDAANNYPGFFIEYNVYDSEGCGAPTYYGPYGVISSPNYPNLYYSNLFCNYDVLSSAESSYLFVYETFHTEAATDYVNISCSTDSSFQPQIHSGDVLPDPVSIPSCGEAKVSFVTDYSISYTGFLLHYFISVGGCGNTLFGGSHGYVTSPDYTSYYGNNQNCTNIIWAPEPSHFYLKFLFIDVQACSEECSCDWVEISCLDNNPSDKRRFCGEFESSLDFYQCTYVLVWFHSDSSNIYPGFNLEYNITEDTQTTVQETTTLPTTLPTTVPTTVPTTTTTTVPTTIPTTTTTTVSTTTTTTTVPTTVTTTIPTTTTTTTVPTTVTTTIPTTTTTTIPTTTTTTVPTTTTTTVPTTVTTTTTTTVPTTVPTTLQATTSAAVTTDSFETTNTQPVTTVTSELDCGDTSYYGPTGVIRSPNYPFPYDRDLDCKYYVHASEGSSISFIFKAFDSESNHDLVTISCPANTSFVQRVHSGQSLMDPVSIPWCSLGLVHFVSDESTVRPGFMLNYYVSEGGCGNTVFNESHGYVTTPNWESDYGDNHSCFNIIWTPQRGTVYLDFLEFVLHSCCNCDWLEISCLDNLEYGPYRYCGTYTYDSLTINQCRQTLLWFRSDSSFINKGFNIEYNIVSDGGTSNGSSTTPLPPTTPFPPGSCGNVNYNGPSGTITSPNYPGNYFDSLKCQYYIMGSEGGSIALIFEHFDTQEGKDYVEISCETNASIPAQRFSGATLPQPTTIPSCSQGSLLFNTDSIEVSSGFSVDYYVSGGGCGNTVYTEPIGNVISPNYPSEYGNFHDCYNVIWAPQRSHFHLQYLDFAVQGSEPCSLDWVEISCLDNNPSNKHRFCGSTVYSLDVYQCAQVLVWFHSDGATTYPGFNLEYNVYPDTGCGETSYDGPSGNITSPNFPDFYNNSLVCDYDIYTETPDGSIAIVFTDFNTERCCDFVTVSCPTNSSFIPVTFSGHSVPPPVSIPWCSQGRVNFGSDISIASPGFSLDYHISYGGCGNTLHNGSYGFVSSPNYPSNYEIDQSCSNIIWAAKKVSFSISFVSIDTEACCDYVEISCLDNPDFIKQEFSGDTVKPPFDIPQCSQVLVFFRSDGSTTMSGFNLEYTVNPAASIHS